jgi:hypothetical protein
MRTINQIKKDFGLGSNNIDELIEILKEKRINLHPDKTNGNFIDKAHEQDYHNVDESIQCLENISSNSSLMVNEQITSLINVVKDLIPNTKESTLQTNLESRINFAIENYKSRLLIPKVSLTAITAVMTFLIAFPTQVKDNIILAKYLDTQSSYFALTWLTMILYTGAFWLITYSNQERGKRNLSMLKVDSTQNLIFDDFIRFENRTLFSKDELTNFIFRRYSRRNKSLMSLFFGEETVTLEVAQSIAEIIIARGEKKCILKPSGENSLSDTFIVQNFA